MCLGSRRADFENRQYDLVALGMGSMVRVLQFAQTFLASGQSHTPTLWAGTNQGAIYVFQVSDFSRLRCLWVSQMLGDRHLGNAAVVI